MVIAVIPVLCIVLGALVYALSSNPKTSEMGRIVFACGMLILVYVLAQHVVKLG